MKLGVRKKEEEGEDEDGKLFVELFELTFPEHFSEEDSEI